MGDPVIGTVVPIQSGIGTEIRTWGASLRGVDERKQTPEEIEADRLSEELPREDLPIPPEMLRHARKNLLGIKDAGIISYPVKDQWGHPTGITIQHQTIFDRPVLSIVLQDDQYPGGIHINVTIMRTDAPVTVTVNKLSQDEVGSYDVKTTKATL